MLGLQPDSHSGCHCSVSFAPQPLCVFHSGPGVLKPYEATWSQAFSNVLPWFRYRVCLVPSCPLDILQPFSIQFLTCLQSCSVSLWSSSAPDGSGQRSPEINMKHGIFMNCGDMWRYVEMVQAWCKRGARTKQNSRGMTAMWLRRVTAKGENPNFPRSWPRGLTVLSRSSAAAVLSAPMRSVREQPCPKRLAIRPSTESHKRMMPWSSEREFWSTGRCCKRILGFAKGKLMTKNVAKN